MGQPYTFTEIIKKTKTHNRFTKKYPTTIQNAIINCIHKSVMKYPATSHGVINHLHRRNKDKHKNVHTVIYTCFLSPAHVYAYIYIHVYIYTHVHICMSM